MENNYDDIFLLERYFDRTLPDEERLQLERRLVVDAEFKELYRQEKVLIQGIQYSHLQDKLEFLETLDRRLPTLDVQRRDNVFSLFSYWKPMAVAASLLIVSFVYFFALDRAPLNERLYQDYFEAFDSPGSGLTRGGNNIVTLKKSAYEAYDIGKFDEAARLFEASLKEKDDAITHLCLGNAYMKLGRWDEATQNFEQILTDHHELVTQAKWYLALTYLRQNKMEKTKSTLWEITMSSTYGEKAKKLLRELD